MTVAKILVDEIIDVAELELDRRADIVEAHDLRVLTDNLEPALEVAEVVVGQLEDEQFVKDTRRLVDRTHGRAVLKI